MLKIIIEARELYDENKEEFVTTSPIALVLEHSLVSLSKWETIWKVPFLTSGTKSREETLDYIKAMTITQNVDPSVYYYMSQDVIDRVTDYIEDPMTATTFAKDMGPASREIITSELIYYWMIHFQIPFECQKWHLNRLLTLIKICNIKNRPEKKRSMNEIRERNRALNAARKAKLQTTG